ncbi:MAG TPA: hypothetical protein VF008_23850, partial [Niastella sp.]
LVYNTITNHQTLFMKMHIKKMLALLILVACMQLSGYASPKHDHLFKMDRGIIKTVPPFTAWMHTTWEGGYSDPYTYIEYKSFRVYYSTYLPYNVTISYNMYLTDVNGSSTTENFAYGSVGSTFTYLGYYETYHDDGNPNNYISLDLGLNYVVQQ